LLFTYYSKNTVCHFGGLAGGIMKKYQVFISSPSEELKSEREEILRKLLEQDSYFPIAMEYFLAYSSTIEMLYRYLQESDIYVLLIGERPGSQIGPEGETQILKIASRDSAVAYNLQRYLQAAGLRPSELTYTEVEYIISLALKLPPLVFAKESIKQATDHLTLRLYLAVRPYVSVYFWKPKDALAERIVDSLNLHVREHPDMTGWIRETDSKSSAPQPPQGYRMCC